MHLPPPTINSRLFHILIRTGLVACSFAVLLFILADYMLTRTHLLEDFKYVTANAASEYVFLYSHDSMELLEQNFSKLKHQDALLRLCAYSREDRLIASWREENGSYSCPPALVKSGIRTTWLTFTISQPVEKDGQYLGMVYADGNLFSLREWCLHVLLITFSLVLIAFMTCRFAAFQCARYMNTSLTLIKKYVKQLQDNNNPAFTLSPAIAAEETVQLVSAIEGLYAHITCSRVTRALLAARQNWHLDIMSTLVSTIASHSSIGSALLQQANDYELFAEIERGSEHTTEQLFNIEKVLAASVASVKREFVLNDKINLTASIQSDMPRVWQGNAEMLETLLRHLLLICLRRTTSGFICLRLEASRPGPLMQSQLLYIKLEDSGSAIQPWQLNQWLDTSLENTARISGEYEISWILAARLFRHLSGGVSAESPASGGLQLYGWLPFSLPDLPVPHDYDGMQERFCEWNANLLNLRIILLVEPRTHYHGELTTLFAGEGYQLFIVTSNARALDIAPVLPFSAVILSSKGVKDKEAFCDRIYHLMQEGLMAQIPVWLIVPKKTFDTTDDLHSPGVTAILPRPFDPEVVSQLCLGLKAPYNNFYRIYNEYLRNDLPSVTTASLPRLNHMLAAQVGRLDPLIRMLAQGEHPADAMQQAHAVKSAALTLGYFRLAALMGEIEYAVIHNSFAANLHNWVIIRDALQTAGMDNNVN